MGQQYISGEEYQRRRLEAPKSRGNSKLLLAGIAVAVVLLGGGIFGGAAYLRHSQDDKLSPPIQESDSTGATDSNNTGISNGSGGGSDSSGNTRGTGHSAVTGTVTAISATSITVQPSGGGDVQTLTITNNTSFSNTHTQSFGNASSGQGDYTDVHVGDVVLVSPDASHAGQAIGVLLNP